MDLAPYSGAFCRMCLCLAITYHYCVNDCQAGGDGTFDGATAMGKEEQPHLHRKCERCGFEWLEQTAPA